MSAEKRKSNGSGDLPFVHVTARILSGRSKQQKNADLAGHILAVLKLLQLSSISLTIEVIDIDRDGYAKSAV